MRLIAWLLSINHKRRLKLQGNTNIIFNANNNIRPPCKKVQMSVLHLYKKWKTRFDLIFEKNLVLSKSQQWFWAWV